MFKQLTDKINYSQLEQEVLKFWNEQKIFEKSISSREGKSGFTFYEGPPTANGRPGIHHVMARTLKDLVCRYKTMRGYQVHRKAGWDTHGLPVEIEVEKSLGFKHKEEIVKFGVAKFNEECRKSVWKYKTDWEQMTQRMGYWVNLNDPYVTFENNYIESIWWSLKQYFDKGLIYKGYKVQPYCPRCETPLSSHEVSLGYEDVKDPSVYVKMKVKGEENTYFLVWTTTPWTLISNVALAVHPNVDYVKVEHKGEYLILAETRLEVLDGEFIIIKRYKGNELVGKTYFPIFSSKVNLKYRFNKREYYLSVNTGRGYKLLNQNLNIQEPIKKAYVRSSKKAKRKHNDRTLVIARVSNELVLMPFVLWLKLKPKSTIITYLFNFNILDYDLVDTDELNRNKNPHIFQISGPQAFCVVEADFVTTEDGSGIVHMAPAYGEDDYQTGRKYGLPTIHPVNKSGEFNPEVTDFAGKFVKDADADIIRNLKERHILYKKETITHSYPHCWRCKTPLLYYARESWYIATTKYAQRMVELNKTINWYPPEVGEGRFGNWLAENKDWSLSRDRFWGTPLPIWICSDCGKQHCVGSVSELQEVSGLRFQVSDNKQETENRKLETENRKLDLHKPFVDEITWNCSCGGTMKRTPELIDVWYDSGAMPFAQWHYPFENKELIDSGEQHPADFICEGIDQTRGWFYSLHSISTFLFDRPAYKNLLVNDLILDKDGKKMSKSLKNTVDPFMIIDKYGADTTRWYLVTNSPPWRPTLFNEEGMGDTQRKFFSTLLNTYSFFSMYANIDGFTFDGPGIKVQERPEIDRWIISVMNSLIKDYIAAMETYDVTKAARAVSDFTIDQLSNWYVRRNRRRFWSKALPADANLAAKDKASAYQTLYECLLTISTLIAPFSPFIADELYRNLNSESKREPFESVHLAEMPTPDESVIDAELESRMQKTETIVSLVRAIRNKANLKVRLPLKRIILPIAEEKKRHEIEMMEAIILEEINVKKIDYVHDDSEIVSKKVKPNFKSLGPKHGKGVQPVANAIRNFTPADIKQLQTNGSLTMPLNGSDVVIALEDVEIIHEDIKGWLVESDGTITVALDTELTPELIEEGFAREFVNRVQNMRKDADFEVMDRIKIYFSGTESLTKALRTFDKYIMNETLAIELNNNFQQGDFSVEDEINGERCSVGIQRVTN